MPAKSFEKPESFTRPPLSEEIAALPWSKSFLAAFTHFEARFTEPESQFRHPPEAMLRRAGEQLLSPTKDLPKMFRGQSAAVCPPAELLAEGVGQIF
jgi:hypothetical protein